MELLLFIAIVVQFIAILIICSRTSHIESVANTLSRIEKKLDQSSKDLAKPDTEQNSPPQSPEAQMSDEELMNKYGITFDNDKYHFQNYKYDRLEDAVNFAKHNK